MTASPLSRAFRRMAALALVAIACGFALSAQAQTVRINIATVAPEKSPYGEALSKVAAEWKKISAGRVELKVFYGDKFGDEAALVDKMLGNSLQGAVLTTVGLAYIDKAIMTISAPLLIDNDDDLKLVLDNLRPEIAARLASPPIAKKAAKPETVGFELITLSRGGWLHFFSKMPFSKPADIKKQRLGISAKSAELYETFKNMNYQVVNVDITETLANLLTGRAEAIFTSPLVAGAYNWVGSARYMLDLPISPFFGGFVINKKTWERIPADLREPLRQAADRIAMANLDTALVKLTADAIAIMEKTEGGLIMQRATEADRVLWRTELSNGLKLTLGNAFDKGMYDKIQAILASAKKK